MSDTWSVEYSASERIGTMLEKYGTESVQVIKDYFDSTAYQKIENDIQRLIHPSGRTWKGKKPSATTQNIDTVFKRTIKDGGLTLEIGAKYPSYNYLYFPDDDEDSKSHAGHQQFMLRGAEEASPEIADDLLQRLVAAFEEG